LFLCLKAIWVKTKLNYEHCQISDFTDNAS
jgi:hypothetical protein